MTELTMTQMLQAVLDKYQGLQLAAKDNQKLLASVLAQHGLDAQGFSAEINGETHLVLKLGARAETESGLWIDCGREAAYQASFSMLPADIEIADCQAVEVPLLDEHRIALMCMQSAHFDHCY